MFLYFSWWFSYCLDCILGVYSHWNFLFGSVSKYIPGLDTGKNFLLDNNKNEWGYARKAQCGVTENVHRKEQVGSSTKNPWVSGNGGRKARHVNDAGLQQGSGLLNEAIIITEEKERENCLPVFPIQ